MTVSPVDDLQAVLDACAGSGKTILLKAGEYKVSKTYNIPSGIHLRGEGLGTVFVCEPTIFNSAFAFDGFGLKDVTLSDFVIDGAWDHHPGYDPNTGRFDRRGRLGNSLNGLTCQGDADQPHSNILLRNLTVINFSRNGVYFSDTEGLRIEGCDFTENGSHVVPGDRIQHNLLLQNYSNEEMDYKTDRVRSFETLSARYALQLQLYGDALSRFWVGPLRDRRT